MIQAHKAICCQNLLKLNPVNCEVQSFSEWSYNSDTIGTCCQGIIQKKSASGSWTLPCLVIFFQGLILIWKCQKWSLNGGTLVSATAIYQTKWPFTVLSVPFLFFRTLPDDSRLFPVTRSELKVFYKNIIHQRIIVFIQLFVAEIFAFYIFADVCISGKCSHHQKTFT